LKGEILTGKNEGMKTGKRQGEFLDGIKMIGRQAVSSSAIL
jgi:hypothetical protein